MLKEKAEVVAKKLRMQNRYKVKGSVALIEVKFRGKARWVLIDKEDLPLAGSFKKWRLLPKANKSMCVVTSDWFDKKKSLVLARQIMSTKKGDDARYIDGDPLNCRKANLKNVKHSQVVSLKRTKNVSSSGYQNIHVTENGNFNVSSRRNGYRNYGTYRTLSLALEARERMNEDLRREVLDLK